MINLKQASLCASNRGESTALEHRKDAAKANFCCQVDNRWGELKPKQGMLSGYWKQEDPAWPWNTPPGGWAASYSLPCHTHHLLLLCSLAVFRTNFLFCIEIFKEKNMIIPGNIRKSTWSYCVVHSQHKFYSVLKTRDIFETCEKRDGAGK